MDDQTFACEGDTVRLDVYNDSAMYLWQDGSTTPVFEITEDGVYVVAISTICETRTDSTIADFFTVNLELGNDTTLCEGETLLLDASVPGATYTWQDSSTNAMYEIQQAGIYSVVVNTACGDYDDRIEADYIPKITVDLGADMYLCADSIILDATSHDRADYQWNDGKGGPTYAVTRPGTYYAIVFSDCEWVSDTITFFECESCPVFVPNVFSPNVDGHNDLFGALSGCDFLSYDLQVYNRWGARVFATTDATTGWNGKYNGKFVSPGVYVYQLEYVVVENEVPRAVQKAGTVTVVR